MSSWRRILSGTVMAGLSSVLLFGSILLSYAENGYALAVPAAGTQTITAVAGVVMDNGMPYANNITPGSRPTDTPTFTPNPECIPPEGYVVYIVRPGDTLSSLAHKHLTSEIAILKASCFETAGLTSISLVAGSVLYVPEIHPTSVAPYCSGAPYGWPTYPVRPGDTLFSLALNTHVTVAELQQANCLGTSTAIYTGQVLHLPIIPYFPPVPSAIFPPTVTPSATATPTASRTPLVPPSWTPVTPATNTGTAPTATSSSTPDATATSSPSPTASDTPAFQPSTSTPIPTATDTPVPPPTNTPVPPPMDTPVPAPTNTNVPPPSDTTVPQPADTPISVPMEPTPNLPEATAGIGLQLYPFIWITLKV